MHLLPTLWFRNTWAWGYDGRTSPVTGRGELPQARSYRSLTRPLGEALALLRGAPELLFTENETNHQRLYGVENRTPYVKDGIDDYIVHGAREAVNPERTGTKAAAHYPCARAGRSRNGALALHRPGQVRPRIRLAVAL